VAAEHAVLIEHQDRVLHLGHAGGEMVVPEESHLLAQGVATLHHAIEPPAAELIAGVVAVGSDPAGVDQGLGGLGSKGPTLKQEVERALRAEAVGLQELVAAGAERRPAV
jgi:hypothetical protein